MLFNSYTFIFLFLPVVLAGYHLALQQRSRRIGYLWLLAASLIFYGWWSPAYLLLLFASIAANFWIGRALVRGAGRGMLAFGVTANLATLAYYKYSAFLLDNLNVTLGTSWQFDRIVLPLAISFYTFQQIAYLVDAHRGLTKDYGFVEYALFITFFPQLIAGPIVHHNELIPQFHRADARRWRAVDFSVGLALLAAGLFKKVVMADSIAPYASAVFAAAARGDAVSLIEAWAGALAYTVQIYFDFSGYCDMASGAARMFGVVLPMNFASPYRAASIIDFWRRWHITLSRFLRDYLYFPLGGNRKGAVRRHGNLLLTMLLGGLWHGAGWTFVIWGGLHGVFLALNHLWRESAAGRWCGNNRLCSTSGWALTFLCVIVAWVFFRASDLTAAAVLLKGMVGLNGVVLPERLAFAAGWLPGDVSIRPHWESFGGLKGIFLLGLMLAVALIFPNVHQLLHRYRPALNLGVSQPLAVRLCFRISPAWALAVSLILVFAVLGISTASEFLYFNF